MKNSWPRQRLSASHFLKWQSALLFLLPFQWGLSRAVLAQTELSTCSPPQSNEYLVLVNTPTTENQSYLRSQLPESISSSICRYQDSTVTRIEGMPSIDFASQWGRYINEVVGLSAVVAQPSTQVQLPPSQTSFNPQPLENGYAVLVNYFNDPTTANQLRELLGRDIGLTSYLARPYLLTMQTTNQREANEMLRRLSDRGYWAIIVDSRRVTLLSPAVSY